MAQWGTAQWVEFRGPQSLWLETHVDPYIILLSHGYMAPPLLLPLHRWERKGSPEVRVEICTALKILAPRKKYVSCV